MGSFEERKKAFKEKQQVANININATSVSPDTVTVMRDMMSTLNGKKQQDRKYDFDPTIVSKKIAKKQFLQFASFVKDTPYENFIAFRDPKVQELLNYILSVTKYEYEEGNSDSLPIKFLGRIKSNYSFKDKIDRYSKRDDRQNIDVSDYFGFKILPEKDIDILDAQGDYELQKLIIKKEEIREYLTSQYKSLSKNPNMTCIDYCSKCNDTIERLKSIFPEGTAVTRIEYYNSIKSQIEQNLNGYLGMLEDPSEEMHINDISKIISVDLGELLAELQKLYLSEVTLHKLKTNMMNVFQNSTLLKNLGVSIVSHDEDKQRTKTKRSDLGYISEFIGINLNIPLENGEVITLPIECQIQARGNYEDSEYGFASHLKLPGKSVELENNSTNEGSINSNSIKLKPFPKPLDKKRFKDKKEKLKMLRDSYMKHEEFLEHLMNICPTKFTIDSIANNFGRKSVVISQINLYEAFTSLARVPEGSAEYNTFSRYSDKLFERRNNLIPNVEQPKYIRPEDIPNPNADYTKYNQFFNELKTSLKKTFQKAFGNHEQEKRNFEQPGDDDGNISH